MKPVAYVGLGVLIGGVMWSMKRPLIGPGLIIMFLGVAVGFCGIVAEPLLERAVEVQTPKTGVVVASLQVFDAHHDPQTVVQVDGYLPGIVLTYSGHRMFQAGSSIAFVEVSIGGKVRRLII